MRDGGFEFYYGGKHYRTYRGEIIDTDSLNEKSGPQEEDGGGEQVHPYYSLINIENYMKLLNSGMFWEFHPELSGDFPRDHRYMLRELYPPTKLPIDQFTGREIGGILNYYNIKNK
jgi:hypothetical protein